MNPIIAVMEASLTPSEQWQKCQSSVNEAQTLSQLVCAIINLAWFLAQKLLEAELESRACQNLNSETHLCPHCGSHLQSKGQVPRQMQTLLGVVKWKRRVLRCPKGCSGVQKIPSDEQMAISPYQKTSWEVKHLACLLSVFLPYSLSTQLLKQLTGVNISESSLWNWVQQAGLKAKKLWLERLDAIERKKEITPESMEKELEQLTMILAADGVMVPFRPQVGTAKGKTQWQEVKVAVVARLKQMKTSKGKIYTRLCQRRLVAVLGDIEQLKPRLLWEALHQGLQSAAMVVWLSDGGVGFWRLYRECFAKCAVGILDFYHAAGHLWRAANAWWAKEPEIAQICFERWRYYLRNGKHNQVLSELTRLVNTLRLNENERKTFAQVQSYFETHRSHVTYEEFKQQNFPLGSGVVESACKWLIQQRFKGVGMRWSVEGFEHLLYLRLAWVNKRFDHLFPSVPLYSPKP